MFQPSHWGLGSCGMLKAAVTTGDNPLNPDAVMVWVV